jgi:hypothetical protein
MPPERRRLMQHGCCGLGSVGKNCLCEGVERNEGYSEGYSGDSASVVLAAVGMDVNGECKASDVQDRGVVSEKMIDEFLDHMREAAGKRKLNAQKGPAVSDNTTPLSHQNGSSAAANAPAQRRAGLGFKHHRRVESAGSNLSSMPVPRSVGRPALFDKGAVPESLLGEIRPGKDLRSLARTCHDDSLWDAIESLLPSDYTALRSAAGARNAKNMRVMLSHILSSIQILQASLAITDNAEAAWDQDKGEWAWSVSHSESSLEHRAVLFAWHFVASRAEQLELRWGVERGRASTIALQLRDRLGFSLLPNFVLQAHHDVELMTRSSSTSTPGRPSILCRIELSTFQRRALLALPSKVELHRALTGVLCGRKSADGFWLYDGSKGSGPCDVYELPSWEEGLSSSLIYMRRGVVVGVFDPKGINHQKPRKPQLTSKFMPEQVNWKARADGDKKRSAQSMEEAAVPSTCKPIPDFDITRVAERARIWKQRLPDIGMATKIILEGKLALPLISADIPAFDTPNLPTCNDAPGVIDALIAEYLIQGVLEYCPPGREPRCISGLGLVPKKTAPFFRLIVDLRKANLFHAEWRTHMSGLSANAMAFNPGAVAFSRDLKSAYLLSGLGGCEPGLHYGNQPKRMKIPGVRRKRIGCDPETCVGGCSKSYLGIRWREQIFRYAAPCFGSKHGGNVLETLIKPVVRKLKSFGCDIIEWVDDWLVIIKSKGGVDHNPRVCGGELGCIHCADTFRRAREIETLVDQELDLLGLLTSEKEAPPSQRGSFIGLIWDTVQGSFVLSGEKAESLALEAKSLLSAGRVTPRDAAKWRGKLQWYAPCLEGTRILTRGLNQWIGAPSEEGWDVVKQLSKEAVEDLSFWADNLQDMAGHAKPMWKLSAEELLRRFRNGEHVVDACLSTDASFMGWGAVLELADGQGGRERFSTSGRWGKEDECSEQAHRESTGTVRAFESFLGKLQGKTILHLTDCTPVANAMNAGSKNSLILHRNAISLWKLCARWSLHTVSQWIPGDRMVELGVDELSRDSTIDVHDVRVKDEVWREALHLAAANGMSLHVDWFADPHNTKLPRFWSREPCPGAEGIDALKAISWGRRLCSLCKEDHDHGAWLFPPPPLMPLVVAKLKAERAHGVLLTPFRPDSVWWGALQHGVRGQMLDLSHVGAFEPHVSVSNDSIRTYAMVNWKLVCFDFSADGERRYALQCAGHCDTATPKLSPDLLGHRRHLQSLLVFEVSP